MGADIQVISQLKRLGGALCYSKPGSAAEGSKGQERVSGEAAAGRFGTAEPSQGSRQLLPRQVAAKRGMGTGITASLAPGCFLQP